MPSIPDDRDLKNILHYSSMNKHKSFKERHLPVLLDEVVGLFEGMELETFVDGTLGAGGHSKAILATHPECKRLIGIDQDPVARALAAERIDDERLEIRAGNFSQLEELVSEPIDGILLDLGVSSMQLDMAEKGFSFSSDAPLDMRMDPNGPLTAKEVVNRWPEEELQRIFRDFGEVPSWRAVARQIVHERAQGEIGTTAQLVAILKDVARAPRGKKINPLTLVFQAIRIAVNDELGVLERVLPLAIAKLRTGGRLAVIAFHSLEDRIVKETFRAAAADWVSDPTNPMTGRKEKAAEVKLVTRKPIGPSREEERRNPRARSARLRAVEKLEVP
jgi:16S rRNA (cytosine1402-N4)-methyltransferase